MHDETITVEGFEWVTDDMFDRELSCIVGEDLCSYASNPLQTLVSIDGDIYEALSEYYNDCVLGRLKSKHPKFFEDVMFAQESAAEKLMDMLYSDGPERVLDHLLDTAWMPGEHMTRSSDPTGPYDQKMIKTLDKRKDQKAILSYNTDLPYIGLVIQQRENL